MRYPHLIHNLAALLLLQEASFHPTSGFTPFPLPQWHGVSTRTTTTTPASEVVVTLSMAQVGIFYGTSTGNTQTAAELIYEAFGSDVAAEPVDVDTLDKSQLAKAFGEHDALVVGTPTWNTGADTERSGTGWDEIYYKKLPTIQSHLTGKKVAVFGMGDQVSYAENYADGTGELFDVFESFGCQMLGSWSQEGYEHESSKSIRGDKFCGLLLDNVNQEDLTEERIARWVAQLKEEGILSGGSGGSTASVVTSAPAAVPTPVTEVARPPTVNGQVLTNVANTFTSPNAPTTDGFTPHTNPVTGVTMWISRDGRQSFFTS